MRPKGSQRGFIFIVVIMISLVSVGYAFSGPQLPARIAKPNRSPVVPLSPTILPGQNALQLMTFGAATVTPAPTRPEAESPTCGKTAPPPKISDSGWSCTGTTATKPSSDGFYIPTHFGCSAGSKDPNDNCIPACQNIPECGGLQGPNCEEKVQFFAANADQYGCNAKLKVTNPITGKAVIVRVIDKGPHCSVQQGGRAKFDLSKAAYDAINAGDYVHVEKVGEGTSLGPIEECPPPAAPSQPQSSPKQ